MRLLFALMYASARPSLRVRLGGYVALTKPRIIELLLVTTVPPMIVAQRQVGGGIPSLGLMAATVLCGTLAAGGAHAINMYVDRDIDAKMNRTKNRPLVTGVIEPTHALVFAITIEAIAFFAMWYFVNLISALLALSACLFYVFVYTLWLKRRSKSNIVIGGAAGAVPVLIGWTSVTGHLDWAPIVLFAIIVYWTPPHFWALAIHYKDDYSRADIPMLPSVVDFHTTAVRIVLYTLLLWGLTLLFGPVADMGLIYMGTAVVLGAIFTLLAVQLMRNEDRHLEMRLFAYSITYVTILFGAMALDSVVRGPV